MKLCSLAAHFLPCSIVPDRPQTVTDPWPQGLGTPAVQHVWGISHPSFTLIRVTLPQNKHKLFTQGGVGGLGISPHSSCISFPHYKAFQSTSNRPPGFEIFSLSLSLALTLAGWLFKSTLLPSQVILQGNVAQG